MGSTVDISNSVYRAAPFSRYSLQLSNHLFTAMTALNHSGNAYAAALANAARTPEEFKRDPKIYFHHHNYAKFHFDLGGSRVKSVSFANYRYITDDKREQDQLDLVADVPGSFIYTMADSDVRAALQQELAQEQAKDIMRAAQASSAVNGQVFDPNQPIVPVNVAPVVPTQNLQFTPVPQQGVSHVGLQNSFSGTQAAEPITGQKTEAATQTKAPTPAAEAMARLNALTADANKEAVASK